MLLYLWAAGSWSLKYVYLGSIFSLMQISLNIIDSPLMMAQSRAENTRDTCNYGQYINQFPQNTIKVIREFERIQKKICRHKMSIMFNEICIYIYIYIRIFIYYIYIIYIFIYCMCVCVHPNVWVCVCVCVCVCRYRLLYTHMYVYQIKTHSIAFW